MKECGEEASGGKGGAGCLHKATSPTGYRRGKPQAQEAGAVALRWEGLTHPTEEPVCPLHPGVSCKGRDLVHFDVSEFV